MSDALVATLATRLDDAARHATSTPQLSLEHDLSTETAYAIQAASIGRRLARGEKVVGVKMGLTSLAKAKQMGVHEVIWGRLTDAMRIADGGAVAWPRYVHPRAEPEIAYVVGKRIDRAMSPEQALAHVASVAPAIEVIDSRYENFKFALADVIADNASSSGFVIGKPSPTSVEVGDLAITFEVDGKAVQVGSSAAILGHPGRSLAAATALATKAGVVLEPGFVIMAGGATEAVALQPGQVVRVTIAQLGSASFAVTAG